MKPLRAEDMTTEAYINNTCMCVKCGMIESEDEGYCQECIDQEVENRREKLYMTDYDRRGL